MTEIDTSISLVYLTSLPKNKLCIIPCTDSHMRKALHQYLEKHVPKTGRVSLQSQKIPIYEP